MNSMNLQTNETGFTLVELLIALGISGVVIASIYTVFMAQQNSYYAQDQTAMMQQNIRGGLGLLVREARLAGFDPQGTAGASITTATNTTLRFTLDVNEDGDVDVGDPGEDISYYRYQNADGIWCLGRSVHGQPPDAVAENIDQLEFYYTLNDGTQTLNPGNLDNVRSVQISILARASIADSEYLNNRVYVSAAGTNWPAANDNFRRRLLITSVQFRNMGLSS